MELLDGILRLTTATKLAVGSGDLVVLSPSALEIGP